MVVVRLAPVRVSVTVTVAPEIGAPVSSVTVPWTDEVICWAAAGAAIMPVAAVRLTTDAARRYLIFIERIPSTREMGNELRVPPLAGSPPPSDSYVT